MATRLQCSAPMLSRFALVPVAAFAVASLNPPRVHAEGAAAPYVMITDVSVKEGDAGTTKFTASVSLHSWGSPLRVNIAAIPGTADGKDFTFPQTVLTLNPNGPAQTVTGEIVGDQDPETDETFELRATGAPPDGGFFPSFVGSSGGRVTIVDDDSARAPRLHVEGRTLMEGNAGATPVEVRVRLEPAVTHPVVVDYGTMDGTAQSGSDYRATNGTLTFAPGEVLKTVTVEVLGDTAWEREERFTFMLSRPQRALTPTPHAEIVIVNDDAPSVVTIADATVDEGDAGEKTVTLVARFDRPVPPDAKLGINVTAGSAQPGVDFKAKSETLYPRAGSVETTFSFQVLGDRTRECDEGVLVEYAGVYTGDDARKTAKILIRDDDGGPDSGDCPDPFTPRAGTPRDAEPPMSATDVGAPSGPGAIVDAGAPDTAVKGNTNPDATANPDGTVARPAPDDGDKGSSGGCSVAGAAPPSSLGALVVLLLATRGFRSSRRRTRR